MRGQDGTLSLVLQDDRFWDSLAGAWRTGGATDAIRAGVRGARPWPGHDHSRAGGQGREAGEEEEDARQAGKGLPTAKKTKAGKKSALRGTLGLARICHQGCLVGEGEAHKCTG